ncbi:glycosyltransferase family 2 protein [uncultured Candidatus Kuenenia sp.]|uniref:glycosyltransferase family 2 protein n=1 Tax=uncultured Candidatus Kuenenia sp. TaxID=1048336 RepID=UPI0025D6B7A3|nr:glycosyltransferase family 2 protein [uncultured Candidatus Kuenenia sp.]
MKYKLSAIMPALNEEGNIVDAVENVIDSCRKVGCSVEVIVVNDGSTDKTELMVNGLMEKYPFVKMIRHDKPKGIGASYWEGVRKSQGEMVTYIPGDFQNDAYETLRYLPVMDHVDIVIPFFYNMNVRTWSRRMISKFYKGIINVSFGILLNYMNGPVIFRKCVLENVVLKSTGFFYQTELLIKCLNSGYLYAEVSCAVNERTIGVSKALTLRSFYKVITDYLYTMAAVYVFDRKDKSIMPNSVTALRHEQHAEFIKNQQLGGKAAG